MNSRLGLWYCAFSAACAPLACGGSSDATTRDDTLSGDFDGVADASEEAPPGAACVNRELVSGTFVEEL